MFFKILNYFISTNFALVIKKVKKVYSLIFLLFTEYPYKFVKVLKHQQLTEKDTLTLLCELDDAAGDVKWTKNDKELKPDKR